MVDELQSKMAASKLCSVHVSMSQIIDYDMTASGEEVWQQNSQFVIVLMVHLCRQEHTSKEEKYGVMGGKTLILCNNL